MLALWARYHACGRGATQEGEPELDAARAGLARGAVAQQVRLDRVAQQRLVDRPPPRTARLSPVERGQHAAPDLPPHEGDLGPPVRADAAPAGPLVVEAGRQSQPLGRIVADGGDQLVGVVGGRRRPVGVGTGATRTLRHDLHPDSVPVGDGPEVSEPVGSLPAVDDSGRPPCGGSCRHSVTACWRSSRALTRRR